VGALVVLAAVFSGPAGWASVTSAEVREAIQRGVSAIRAAQSRDGSWGEREYPGGLTALATLALLQAGTPADAAPVQAAVRFLSKVPDEQTYVVSLKLMVLARVDAQRYRADIQAAADWLIRAQGPSGLWNYTAHKERFDHSNSQFALLGLHAAAQAGVRVPPRVWQAALQGVLSTQQPDGGWTYQARGTSTGSMTAANVANLYILGLRLEAGQEKGFVNGVAPGCGRYRAQRDLARGLTWLGRNFRADVNPGDGPLFTPYWLYAAERCGVLSGQRMFGPHDWYRAGGEYLVGTQRADGRWSRNLADTCFAVLFLAKGRQPLLVQKLQWSSDDAWTPDRYDLAHLTAFIGSALGEPVAWQSVPFDAPLEDWLAAPLLFVHGHRFPAWNAAQRAKVRRFVEQGGTVLFEACCGQEAFRRGFEQFAAETFPEAPLRTLGDDHAVYRVLHEVPPYGLMGIDFACRTSVLFAPQDLSCLWEQADIPRLSQQAFQIGANIAAYAVGRRPLRDRLDAVVLPPPAREGPREAAAPAGALELAQLVYEGDWRPFPGALAGLAEFLRDQARVDVVTRSRTLRPSDPTLYLSPVLYLAGHYPFALAEGERAALRDHLRRGGFLLADACCGTEPFEASLRRLLEQMFPDAQLERLPADHPIFTGRPGFDVTQVRYTPDVERARPGLRTPELWGLRIDGRLAVVYSPYSLGCGLAGPTFDGCWGLVREDAQRLAANIVLYALSR